MSFLGEDRIMLEPRLMQYIEKTKYYKNNNIDPVVPLEQEYGITDKDVMKIRAYRRGDNENVVDKFQDLVDPSDAQFPSATFEKDERFNRLKKKQQRDRDANNQRHDYDIMADNYDMYGGSKRFASTMGDNFSHNTIDKNNYSTRSNKSNRRNEHVPSTYESGRNFRGDYDAVPKHSYRNDSRKYSNPSRIPDYRARLHNGYVAEGVADVDNIIGRIDSYRDYDTNNDRRGRRSYGRMSQMNPMDLDTKRVLPNNRNNNKRDKQNNYMAVPYMSGNGIRDMDMDNYIRSGDIGSNSTQSRRSIGYPSTFEHGFQYISNDMQIPEHTVMDRGFASRNLNKSEARQKFRYEREVMP
jgi:hypothetical protein